MPSATRLRPATGNSRVKSQVEIGAQCPYVGGDVVGYQVITGDAGGSIGGGSFCAKACDAKTTRNMHAQHHTQFRLLMTCSPLLNRVIPRFPRGMVAGERPQSCKGFRRVFSCFIIKRLARIVSLKLRFTEDMAFLHRNAASAASEERTATPPLLSINKCHRYS